jgi:hypothetical protein
VYRRLTKKRPVVDAGKTKPIAGLCPETRRHSIRSPQHEYRNPRQKRLTEADLKKQSQFVEAEITVTTFIAKAYDNIPTFGVGKNKANSKHVLCAVEWAKFKMADWM